MEPVVDWDQPRLATFPIPDREYPLLHLDVAPLDSGTFNPSKASVDHQSEHQLVPDSGVGSSFLDEFEQAVELTRRGGSVSLVGVPNAPSQINAAGWLVKEVRLTASLGYLREEFAVTQALVADGRIQLSPMHTSTVSLGSITEAFDKLATEPEEVKVLVDPNL